MKKKEDRQNIKTYMNAYHKSEDKVSEKHLSPLHTYGVIEKREANKQETPTQLVRLVKMIWENCLAYPQSIP